MDCEIVRIFFFAFDVKIQSGCKLATRAGLCHMPRMNGECGVVRDQVPLRHKVEIILLVLLPVSRTLGRLHGVSVSHFRLALRGSVSGCLDNYSVT